MDNGKVTCYAMASGEHVKSRYRRRAMGNAVYTPKQVAEILQVTEADIMKLVRSGQLEAFSVLGRTRIQEAALARFIKTAQIYTPKSSREGTADGPDAVHAGSGAQTKPKNRDPEAVATGRQWAWREIKRVAPDMNPPNPTSGFAANGKQGILCVSTRESGAGASFGYWLGFGERLLSGGRETLIVAVLAEDDPKAFVVPYQRHRAAIDGLSSSRGQRKLILKRIGGSYVLTGRGIRQPIDIGGYLNAFHLFR